MALGKLGKMFGSDEFESETVGGGNVNQELLEILEEVVYQTKLSSTFLFSGWEGVDDALADLLPILEGIRNNEKKAIKKLDVLFEPKGSLQELATDNGWMEDFEKLADRFDTFMEELEARPKKQPPQVAAPKSAAVPKQAAVQEPVKPQERKLAPDEAALDEKPDYDSRKGTGSKIYRYYTD